METPTPETLSTVRGKDEYLTRQKTRAAGLGSELGNTTWGAGNREDYATVAGGTANSMTTPGT